MPGTTQSISDDPVRDERFRLGIEGSGLGTWDLDLSTKQLIWSATTRRLFGYSDKDDPVSYDLFLSLLEPGDRGRTEQAIRRSTETGHYFDVSYRLARTSGLTHWVRVRGSLVRDEGGVPRHLSGIVLDIDEEKQLEEALRTREGHLQSILEAIPDAMIVIDGRGTMQFFSSAAERQFGYREHEAIGRNVSMLMPNPDRSRHDGYLARYRSSGERHIIGIGRIVTGQRNDGTTFPMHLSIGEMQSGGVPYFTGFVRDLTEHQQTQARLQELQSELVHVSRLSAMGEMASDRLIGMIDAALKKAEPGAKSEAVTLEIASRIATLSPRERQVMEGLIAGLSNKLIAREYDISPRTIEVYRANVMTKMQAASLSELVRLAMRGGALKD